MLCQGLRSFHYEGFIRNMKNKNIHFFTTRKNKIKWNCLTVVITRIINTNQSYCKSICRSIKGWYIKNYQLLLMENNVSQKFSFIIIIPHNNSIWSLHLNYIFTFVHKYSIALNFQFHFRQEWISLSNQKRTHRLKNWSCNKRRKWFILIVSNSIVIFITLHNCGQAKHKSIFNFVSYISTGSAQNIEHKKNQCCTYTH